MSVTWVVVLTGLSLATLYPSHARPRMPTQRGPGYGVLFDAKGEQSPCPTQFSHSLVPSPAPHSGSPTFPSSTRCLGWLGRTSYWFLLCRCSQVPISSIPCHGPWVALGTHLYPYPGSLGSFPLPTPLLQPGSSPSSFQTPFPFQGYFFLGTLLLAFLSGPTSPLVSSVKTVYVQKHIAWSVC